jgi:Na+:H+ antiporter, NhaA family
MAHSPARPPASVLRNLLTHEASGGLILMASAAVALIVANSAASGLYEAALARKVAGLSVLHWINDALMALFFLLVGLEIKRELLDGHLARWEHRVLPGIAAAGGMIAPALVYLAFNLSPETARGWGIPAATDIAFSLGVLAILGSRVPVAIKVFLTALAIIDDLGAIVIIALFYGGDLSLPMLGLAALTMAALIALNRLGVMRLIVYAPLGLLLWYFVLRSGIHATVAGVLFALTIPLQRSPGYPDDTAASPLHRLENMLHPYVAFAVLPIFGLANAGVPLGGLSFGYFLQPVTLGIALGLFVGKQIGVFGSVWLAVNMGLASRPAGTSWRHLYGMSLLCGIGFTMSLFIGLLAFGETGPFKDQTKIGVLLGSFLSAVAGWAVLRLGPQHAGGPRS